ncbi:MAG TPA: ATP-binding protein [Burkholderiales bacterium]|jgi:signal transduction histidine kinase
MEPRIRLLLVEDDRVDQLAFTRAVRDQGWPYDYAVAASVKEARALLQAERFDVVVTDYLLGDGIAFEFFPLIAPAALIVTTGSGDEAVAVSAMKGGADDYLIKDPERHYLMVLPFTVESALERRRNRDRVARLMEDLEKRSAKLAAVNRDLESFSYTIAHDLRSPLRSINGFISILLAEEGSGLAQESRELLKRVVASCDSMDHLIESLLSLYQLDRETPVYAEFELSALAAEVAAGLRAAEPARAVQFVIAPEVKVNADARLMRGVMANLLGNAWKFTARHAQARIEFGTQPGPKGPVYFVRDDGAGFDAAYKSKLFQTFQRLHAASEFPGTGIGLASVARVIRHHGGELWAEGAVEQGATFYFTLPPPRAVGEGESAG